MVHMPWKDVANMDDTPFIVVTTEGMDDIAHGSHGWGSWNVSDSEVDILYGLFGSDKEP